jgi:hypothetical protein
MKSVSTSIDRISRELRSFIQRLDLRARSAWILFLAVCLQLAFLTPYIVVVKGVRSNLFSGFLCALALGAAILFAWKRRSGYSFLELVVSVTLTTLVILSSLSSATPFSSSCRGFVVLASGLGGYWCARILVTSRESYLFFRNFCLLILIILLITSAAGYLTAGEINRFLDSNPHPLANRILLLWFAPISMALTASTTPALTGWIVLIFSYLVFFISDLRSAMYIPAFLLILATALRKFASRILIFLLLIMCLILIYFVEQLPRCKMDFTFESTYYRVENYFFSWHIAVRHPFLGIGLRAPRLAYLEGYHITYPYATKKEFTKCVVRIRTSENIFLTFMAELGFPFFIIYTASLAALLTKLGRSAMRSSVGSSPHPLALLLALCAGVLHYLVFDGLLVPQSSWFFHILLGLIPASLADSKASSS